MNKLPRYLSYRNNELYFNDINLMDLIKKYGDCLEVCCPNNMEFQVKYLKDLFNKIINKHKYNGSYYYAYATKANYDKEIIMESLKHIDYIETTSKNDLGIIEYLYENNKFDKNMKIICNGFKDKDYFDKIFKLKNYGLNIVPILENIDEIDYLINKDINIKIGIRINIDNEKNMFYKDDECTRFGIYYKDLKKKINTIKNSKLELEIFHFHLNGGLERINDFNNFLKYIFKEYYVPLKQKINSLNYLDIGGGMVIDSIHGFDYELFIDSVIKNIKDICVNCNIDMPNIISENGTYTVADCRFNIYKVKIKKKIEDNSYWYILNNSISATLPDTWILGSYFLVLPVNLINNKKINVRLSSLTCDHSDEYYYQEGKKYLKFPKINDGEELYIAFFRTGAYQGILSGKNTIHHCLIEEPKKLLITNKIEVLKEKQTNDDILKLLNYK